MKELSFHSAAELKHAYILASPSQEECLCTAGRIAAAAVCRESRDVPCGVCRACRKAFAGVHPDIITVRRLPDKNGNLKKEIVVDQVRELVMDAPVLPNESDRKVYIIEEADRMNLNAQNAALKLLEEPPAGVILLLCVENPGLMLETVRSRCAVISVGGEAAEDESSLALANGLLKALDSGKPEELFLWIGKNEQSSAAAVQAFLEAALQLVADRLGGRTKSEGLTAAQLMKLAALLEQCSDYSSANVGSKHIFSLIAAGGLKLLAPENEED